MAGSGLSILPLLIKPLMQSRSFALLILIGLGLNLGGCMPRLHGSYAVQPSVANPAHVTLTFTGNRFRSCYDGVNNGSVGSGNFILRKGILTLHYARTPAYVPSTNPLAMHLPESYTRREPAGTVARFRYAPTKKRHAFRLALLLPPVDTAYLNCKLRLGVPAEELTVREPEFQLWNRVSAEEATKCLQEY